MNNAGSSSPNSIVRVNIGEWWVHKQEPKMNHGYPEWCGQTNAMKPTWGCLKSHSLMVVTWGALGWFMVLGFPHIIHFLIGFSIRKTIQILGYTHLRARYPQETPHIFPWLLIQYSPFGSSRDEFGDGDTGKIWKPRTICCTKFNGQSNDLNVDFPQMETYMGNGGVRD